mgnify:CR=1 FL=1
MVILRIKERMRLNGIFLLGISLFFQYSVLAETIILKSGQKIDAKIKGRNSKYIIIDLKGVTLTYLRDDIESIEGVSLKDAETVSDIEPLRKEYFAIDATENGLKAL